ncbi:MAG: carboxypeptidase-like regulatory domain-containing protein [Planctomycetota bacterium]
MREEAAILFRFDDGPDGPEIVGLIGSVRTTGEERVLDVSDDGIAPESLAALVEEAGIGWFHAKESGRLRAPLEGAARAFAAEFELEPGTAADDAASRIRCFPDLFGDLDRARGFAVHVEREAEFAALRAGLVSGPRKGRRFVVPGLATAVRDESGRETPIDRFAVRIEDAEGGFRHGRAERRADGSYLVVPDHEERRGLRGTVRDVKGRALSGARVKVLGTRLRLTSDERGEFLGVIPATLATVAVAVELEGYASEEVRSNVRSGTSDHEVHIVLERRAVIRGRVLDQADAGVAGVSLAFLRDDRGIPRSVRSEADGTFVFDRASEGVWTMSVRAEGELREAVFVPGRRDVEGGDENVIVRVRRVEERPVSLTVRVREWPGDGAIDRGTVRVWARNPLGGSSPRQTGELDDGSHRFDLPFAGEWTLELETRHGAQRQSVRIPPDVTAFEVSLLVGPPGTIRGRLRVPEGVEDPIHVLVLTTIDRRRSTRGKLGTTRSVLVTNREWPEFVVKDFPANLDVILVADSSPNTLSGFATVRVPFGAEAEVEILLRPKRRLTLEIPPGLVGDGDLAGFEIDRPDGWTTLGTVETSAAAQILVVRADAAEFPWRLVQRSDGRVLASGVLPDDGRAEMKLSVAAEGR